MTAIDTSFLLTKFIVPHMTPLSYQRCSQLNHLFYATLNAASTYSEYLLHLGVKKEYSEKEEIYPLLRRLSCKKKYPGARFLNYFTGQYLELKISSTFKGEYSSQKTATFQAIEEAKTKVLSTHAAPLHNYYLINGYPLFTITSHAEAIFQWQFSVLIFSFEHLQKVCLKLADEKGFGWQEELVSVTLWGLPSSF